MNKENKLKTEDDVIILLSERLGAIEQQMLKKPFENADEAVAILRLVQFYDKKLFKKEVQEVAN